MSNVIFIDVGILILGISVGLIDKEISYVDLIDITKFNHEREL